ncbi:hypothetical protein [Stenotrophomonas sp. NPDC077659]|uniref:hypothetical protein n=1 Tax=Stenotrophomonas sp. NPDC077659 TaxID=3390694 RepID=UPI003D076585
MSHDTIAQEAARWRLDDHDGRWPWQVYGGLVQAAAGAGIALYSGNLSHGEVDALLASTAPVQFPAASARQPLSAVVLAQHAGAAPVLVIALAAPGEAVDGRDADLVWGAGDE